ncbi:MAG: hypothetical protein RMK52_04925 [Chitinophagales bacterium]|nr:hypothetical protein [Chitinophagales bacterium]MDW8393569.1 hypothetical protein [Chitinophagales bacterium]
MHTRHELTVPLPAGHSALTDAYRALRVFVAYLIMVRVFGTMIKTPLTQYYFLYVGLPLLFVEIGFGLFYVLNRLLVNKGRFNVYEFVIILLYAYMMLQGGLAPYFFYGQPIFTGMTTYKFWGMVWDGLIVFYLLRIRFLDLTIIRDALLFGAWFQLPVFLLMIFTLNPSQFAGTLFVYCNEAKGGCQFEFEIFFFLFASIYYYVRLIKTNKLHYGLFFLIFFSYIFFINQKRGVSLSLLATVGIYSLFHMSRDKLIYYSFMAVLALGLLVGALYLFYPDVLDRIVNTYTNAFMAVMGERTGEASADARIRQGLIAMKYLDRYPLGWVFGNGKLDTDWPGIPVDFLRFYASDLGIFGVIFQYGVLGLLVGMSLLFLFALRNHQRVRLHRNESFYQAVLYFILFLFIRGIPTGGSFFDPGSATTATFVGIHYFFYFAELHYGRHYKTPLTV